MDVLPVRFQEQALTGFLGRVCPMQAISTLRTPAEALAAWMARSGAGSWLMGVGVTDFLLASAFGCARFEMLLAPAGINMQVRCVPAGIRRGSSLASPGCPRRSAKHDSLWEECASS